MSNESPSSSNNSGYSLQDMENWVQKIDGNIARLEEGIEREREARRHAEMIIADLKEKAQANELSQ